MTNVGCELRRGLISPGTPLSNIRTYQYVTQGVLAQLVANNRVSSRHVFKICSACVALDENFNKPNHAEAVQVKHQFPHSWPYELWGSTGGSTGDPKGILPQNGGSCFRQTLKLGDPVRPLTPCIILKGEKGRKGGMLERMRNTWVL